MRYSCVKILFLRFRARCSGWCYCVQATDIKYTFRNDDTKFPEACTAHDIISWRIIAIRKMLVNQEQITLYVRLRTAQICREISSLAMWLITSIQCMYINDAARVSEFLYEIFLKKYVVNKVLQVIFVNVYFLIVCQNAVNFTLLLWHYSIHILVQISQNFVNWLSKLSP